METRDGWRMCFSCLEAHNYCEVCGSISYEPYGDRHTEQIHYDEICENGKTIPMIELPKRVMFDDPPSRPIFDPATRASVFEALRRRAT
jgi:hypothetical protein